MWTRERGDAPWRRTWTRGALVLAVTAAVAAAAVAASGAAAGTASTGGAPGAGAVEASAPAPHVQRESPYVRASRAQGAAQPHRTMLRLSVRGAEKAGGR